MKIIEPKILKGTRDFLPKDKAKRDYVMSKFVEVFRRFGYDSIETPVIEYAETILGKYGEEGDKLTYNFEDNGGRMIALRYDQTVPFARLYAANNQELPSPFKRYQISRVWRADKPQKGRYREFYQCDIDVIGTESILVELEMVLVMKAAFEALGISNFEIKFNDRAFMDSVLDKAGVDSDQRMGVISVIDKLDKIGAVGVRKELESRGVDVEAISPLLEFDGDLDDLSEFKIDRVRELIKLAGISELKFDPSLARGLDYYTGIVFEGVLPDIQIGSVVGGGRYDNLCGSFSKQEFSGCGIAFGFDRLIVAMEEMGLFSDVALAAQVLVTIFDEDSVSESIKIASQLRELGLNAELYFEAVKLAKQFKYADKKEIPFVIVAGPSEVEKGVVLLKDMQSGEQREIEDLGMVKEVL